MNNILSNIIKGAIYSIITYIILLLCGVEGAEIPVLVVFLIGVLTNNYDGKRIKEIFRKISRGRLG